MKIIKISLYTIIILLIVLILIIVAINIHMVSYSRKYIYDSNEMLSNNIKKPVETVIVFGAYVYENGQPCPMLEDRLRTGIEIFNSKIANTILLTGDNGSNDYDEVNSMKKFVFNFGIKQKYVFLDHAGFCTYDSIIRAADIFLVDSAMLVTQRYHLYRAIYMARKKGIRAYGITADRRVYPKKEMFRYLVREWLARTKDFFLINFLKPEPSFRGKTIPITGNSKPSYDKAEDID